MPKRVDSGQKEFDECHRAKISGVINIQQSMVRSSPDAKTKFGLYQVSTQLSQHLEPTKASADQGGRITRIIQFLRNIPLLTFSHLRKIMIRLRKTMKKISEKVEIGDEGFKIPQATSHPYKKKLEAGDHRKIIACILARDLDPSRHIIDMVKIRHECKPYGLNENEWRCFLITIRI